MRTRVRPLGPAAHAYTYKSRQDTLEFGQRYRCHAPPALLNPTRYAAGAVYLAAMATFMRLIAISFCPALRSLRVAWSFFRLSVSIATFGALPQIHG